MINLTPELLRSWFEADCPWKENDGGINRCISASKSAIGSDLIMATEGPRVYLAGVHVRIGAQILDSMGVMLHQTQIFRVTTGIAS